ncbi:MAG: Histidine kinaselike ATPase domain [Pseudomonadota bacterium]
MVTRNKVSLPFRASFVLDHSGIQKAREELSQALRAALPMHGSRITDIVIAVGEILQNIVRYETPHATSPGFAMVVNLETGALFIDILDNCAPLETLEFLSREHEAGVHGGMGLGIIREVSDAYTIAPEKRGNRHRLRVRLPKPGNA